MELTAEFGTLTARGVFAVADRRFLDRRLTRAEKRLAAAGALYSVPEGEDANTAFLCVMLNRLRLKPSEPEVTTEWLESSLSEEEIALTVTYLLEGAAGVRRVLAQLSGETPPTSAE